MQDSASSNEVIMRLIFILGYALMAGGLSAEVIVPLSPDALPSNMAQNNAEAQPISQDGKAAIQVRFKKADWPNVFFTPEGVWDWSGKGGLAADVYNPETQPITVCMRVDNPGADGVRNCATKQIEAQAYKWTTLEVLFGGPTRFWGMRGTPDHGMGAPLDLSKITAFQVFLPQPDTEHTFVLSNFRLLSKSSEVTLPFVDKFGQYKHADWPGKLKSESDLVQRRDKESLKPMPGRDKFGGWADGQKLNATGWFRTEKVDGRWWLVTPEGHLFFSVGVDCVNTFENTFIEKRESWFEWLPDEDSEFKPAFGYASNVHSMAETIGGKGRTFNFYKANLIRKYGSDWQDAWRKRSYARLRTWGFNTIGNWSDWEVLKQSPLPFVATASTGNDYRRIEGGGGYWGKMADVFDPKFAESADSSIAKTAEQFAGNPLCIGYFVDNEIAWDAIERGPLASPADQPCRIEMVRQLQAKYTSLDALNKAWGTNASTWEDLRVPDQPNDACRKDLDAWVYSFAHRYFEIMKGALRRHAPNQLYLGCRFAWSHPQAVRACADVADVVSFNQYWRTINSADWIGKNDLGKPIIIGEFHFGALDRGMFHTGLVPTGSQDERAAAFKAYVKSVADCPSFVGCHWFQYVDEPLTGRVYDGENYNIGLVDMTDTPYPELTSAGKEVNAEVYKRHAGSH
jgi:hypothetical protein